MVVNGKPEPVADSSYWNERLVWAQNIAEQLHHSVYCCGIEFFNQLADNHRRVLETTIKPGDRILDVGCGYGRLVDMLPAVWHEAARAGNGSYFGVDVSTGFIAIARTAHADEPYCEFWAGRATDLPPDRYSDDKKFDWGIAISVKHMTIANIGGEAWDAIERVMRAACRRVLLFEMMDGGTVLEGDE